jgi:hypothetical protein
MDIAALYTEFDDRMGGKDRGRLWTAVSIVAQADADAVAREFEIDQSANETADLSVLERHGLRDLTRRYQHAFRGLLGGDARERELWIVAASVLLGLFLFRKPRPKAGPGSPGGRAQEAAASGRRPGENREPGSCVAVCLVEDVRLASLDGHQGKMSSAMFGEIAALASRRAVVTRAAYDSARLNMDVAGSGERTGLSLVVTILPVPTSVLLPHVKFPSGFRSALADLRADGPFEVLPIRDLSSVDTLFAGSGRG